MTVTIPSPDMTYVADSVYTNRYDQAMQFLVACLTEEQVINTLTMRDGKAFYVIEYNLARRTLANIDDAMAARIVQAFKAAGWANVHWENLSTDSMNIHNPKWGYNFCFERPLETIPHDVLVRILPAEFQSVYQDSENNVTISAEYLKAHIEKIITSGPRIRPAIDYIGNFYEYMQDLSEQGPKHTGIYKRKAFGDECALLDIGDKYVIYSGPDKPLYVQLKTKDLNFMAWCEFPPGPLTLPYMPVLYALLCLEGFITDPNWDPSHYVVKAQPQYPAKG